LGFVIPQFNLHVEEMNMSVTQQTVFPNVFSAFYNTINDNIPDPSNRNIQWIFSSFPEEDIGTDKLKYPIIVIEPADMSWAQFTQTKAKNMITIAIVCYSTRMEQADSLLSKCCMAVESKRLTLKYKEGLDFLKLESTGTDFDLRGALRAHSRNANFSMQNIFKTSLNKMTKTTTLASDAWVTT